VHREEYLLADDTLIESTCSHLTYITLRLYLFASLNFTFKLLKNCCSPKMARQVSYNEKGTKLKSLTFMQPNVITWNNISRPLIWDQSTHFTLFFYVNLYYTFIKYIFCYTLGRTKTDQNEHNWYWHVCLISIRTNFILIIVFKLKLDFKVFLSTINFIQIYCSIYIYINVYNHKSLQVTFT